MFAAVFDRTFHGMLGFAFIALLPLVGIAQEAGQILEKSQLVIASEDRKFAFRVRTRKKSRRATDRFDAPARYGTGSRHVV